MYQRKFNFVQNLQVSSQVTIVNPDIQPLEYCLQRLKLHGYTKFKIDHRQKLSLLE